MARLISLSEFIYEFEIDTLQEELKKYEVAGEMAMREIRESIVNEWFGQFNSRSMNLATQYKGGNRRVWNNKKAEVTIRSWIDIDRYEPKDKAAAWRDTYGGDKEAEEYVLDLQLYEGIIGLPRESNERDIGWVNMHFHQKIPLWTYLSLNSRWNEFESIVDRLHG